MGCKTLLRELDFSCPTDVHRKYFQQIVLVNLSDLDEVAYDLSDSGHAVAFTLLPGATGYRFRGNEMASNFSASFSKSVIRGQPLYSHSVTMPIIGVKLQTKLVLKELDLANYFAAIQFTDGTVEIYGFENGLSPGDYTYEAQGSLVGTILSLDSKQLEDDIPYIYGGVSSNFDNKFSDIPALLGGDFNDDFSDDFYIIQL